MSQRHEEIAAALSPEAVRALVNSQVSWSHRYELPDRTTVEVMDELAGPALVHGRFLTVRGEVVREYALDKMLEDLG